MSMYGSTRNYNPGIALYKAMDIENLPQEREPSKEGGLLVRKDMGMANKNMDQSNPVFRVAKQMEVIRKYRNMSNDDA